MTATDNAAARLTATVLLAKEYAHALLADWPEDEETAESGLAMAFVAYLTEALTTMADLGIITMFPDGTTTTTSGSAGSVTRDTPRSGAL